MKIALYPNFQKENALECAKQVSQILLNLGVDVSISEIFKDEFPYCTVFEEIESAAASSEFVIAIGGDGTMLRCAKHLTGCQALLLGINTGRLGFMTAIEGGELNKLKNIVDGNYAVSERMMLSGTLIKANGQKFKFDVLNDISVNASGSKAGDFFISTDKANIGTYRADGVLFSTPTGSTAYALSAGGPVIEPDLECIEMSLICPHTLFARPMIFFPERILTIHNVSPKDRMTNVTISIDGRTPLQFTPEDELLISKGRHKIRIAVFEDSFFYDSVSNKLMRKIK